MVLSLEPETTRRSWYCRQAMPLLCPLSVRTNSQELNREKERKFKQSNYTSN